MFSKKLPIISSLLIVAVLLLTACQPAAAPTATAKPAAPAPPVATAKPAAPPTTPGAMLVSEMVVKKEGSTPVQGGTLNMVIAALTHMDPVSIAGDTEPYPLIFETLFEFDLEWKPTPLLVESAKVSPDGLVHTWKLRQGVKFHDGSPFNAEIVKWNIDRKIAANTMYATSIPWAPNPAKVVDEYTLEVTLKTPSFVMYNYLSGSSWMMYSKTFVEKMTPDDLKNKGVGTGPYIIKEYMPNDRLNLERNPNYWQKGLPYFDKINIRIVSDANTRLLMLESGEVQFIKDLSIQDLKRLKGNAKVVTSLAPSTRAYAIRPHLMQPPLDNLKVRQAMDMALDKTLMNKTIFDGQFSVSDGLGPAYLQGYAKQATAAYDPKKAMALLDEVGMKDTNGDKFREWQGKEKEFLLVTRKGQRAGDIELAEQFQAFMAEIGLKVKIEIWDTAQYFTKLNQPFGKAPYYDFSNQSPSNFIGDIEYVLTTSYNCSSFPGTFFNYSHYCNQKVDALINAGLAAPTMEERNKLFAQAQKLIWDDVPTFFIINGVDTMGSSPNLKGVFSDGAHNVWQVKYAWFAK